VTVTVVPLVAALEVWAPQGMARWLAPAWGLAAIGISWTAARSLSGRMRDLTKYVHTMGDLTISRPRLPFHDDEAGELARALSRMAPQVEQVVQGLSTELGRREAILASMTEGVVAVDAKLNVSFCNESFVRAVGHPITEGIPLIKAFRDPGLLQTLQRVIDTGETLRRQLNIVGQEDCSFEVYATPLASSVQRGALAILRDVTPMVRLERAQRDFVANVSHEFRTPLATITGCAETLLHGAWEDGAHRRRFLEIIQANSARLTNIAADLITLSQIDSGRFRSEAMPIVVEEVVSSALRAIEPVASMREVTVRAEEICAAQILGHRLALEQALVNLLDNAVKFNREGGEVAVQAAVGGNQVEISVSDTGIGIPAEDVPRIFERFYRVDKARSREIGGTGLGLSIVRQAVEQMHGAIRVDSEPGRGSTFTITLPLHQARNSS
jgi:two-component system phosphate regulon sensor histidine kinase PhoR